MAGEHYQRVEVTSRQVLRNWLSENHAQKESVWIVTYKKQDERHVPYTDMVREALCFGWIDSVPRKLDALRSMRLLSPRKPKSAWSKVNKDHVAKLIADGLMTEAGLKVIEAAKRAGNWSKLDEVEAMLVPDDLERALAKAKTAHQNFSGFPPSARKAILEWIMQARRPETRAARIAETVEQAKANIRANQWRQPSG
jgi:uncharacterized protein YdeI (YjbR/CyaY-like superfamily)